MEDYDARNHIRDLHREADERRLVRQAQARSVTNRTTKPVNLAFAISILLLALALVPKIL